MPIPSPISAITHHSSPITLHPSPMIVSCTLLHQCTPLHASHSSALLICVTAQKGKQRGQSCFNRCRAPGLNRTALMVVTGTKGYHGPPVGLIRRRSSHHKCLELKALWSFTGAIHQAGPMLRGEDPLRCSVTSIPNPQSPNPPIRQFEG